MTTTEQPTPEKPNRVQVMSEIAEGLRCAVCEDRIKPGEQTRYSPTDGSTIHDTWCPSDSGYGEA